MSGFPQRGRTTVLCFGHEPSEAERREFRNRGLTCARQDEEPTSAQLAAARGAWFAINEAPETAALLARLAPRFADHGILICVTADKDSAQRLAHESLRTIPGEFRRQITAIERPPHRVAEAIARHDPGPRWIAGFEPTYLQDVEKLSADDAFLLARALGDDGEVRLEDLAGGMSRARVFSVHTTKGNSYGSWAQPLFVKIDRRERIAQEARNYGLAAPFIPFGLRPNIEKVILGASRGLLIGNLVDRSQPLWDVIRAGHADEPILNLFNTTLAGWRGQALHRAAQPGPMWAALERAGVVTIDRLRDEYFSEFCSQRKGLRPSDIAQLMNQLPHSYLSGPIHGDLHAGNVRVKGFDAILIDMYSNGEGPMAADVAMLETWIAIALHERDQMKGFTNPVWADVVGRLYDPEAFRKPLPPIEGGSPLRWMWDSVRLIRGIGTSHQVHEGEYQIAVIAALLRLCMFPSDTPAEKFRRMKAYELASRLATAMDQRDVRNVA